MARTGAAGRAARATTSFAVVRSRHADEPTFLIESAWKREPAAPSLRSESLSWSGEQAGALFRAGAPAQAASAAAADAAKIAQRMAGG